MLEGKRLLSEVREALLGIRTAGFGSVVRHASLLTNGKSFCRVSFFFIGFQRFSCWNVLVCVDGGVN